MRPETRKSQRVGMLALAFAGLSATSACSTLGLGRGSEAPERPLASATISGLPNGMMAAARDVIPVETEAPTSVLSARRNAKRTAGRLTEFLSAQGYLLAEVTAQPIAAIEDTPRFDVVPGPAFTIATRDISGIVDIAPDLRGRLESELIAVGEGSLADTKRIEAVDGRLVQIAREGGYPFAESQDIDVLASRSNANVDLTYQLALGPRVRLGRLDIDLHGRTRPDFVRTAATWKPGDLYTPERIQDFRARLRTSQLFENVNVEIAKVPDASGQHPVSVSLSEGKRRSIGAGVTASTTEGVGGDAFWERRNLTSRGDTLRTYVEVATLARAAGISYQLPHLGRYGRTLAVELEARGEETDAYDLQGIKLGAGLSQPFNRNFTISVGASLDATRTSDFLGERDQFTLSLPLAATYSTVKAPLDPQGGNKLFLGVEPGISLGSGNEGYARLLATGSTYQTIVDDKLVVALQGRVGNYFGYDLVPADRRFFAGGGGSVRGYAYQSLSPRDADNTPVGGQALVDMSAELRWRRSERFGYAVFVDAGAAAESLDEAATTMRAAAGLGIRYYPGFGPIRFDVATPLDKRDGEDPVQVYISIGQAF